ncbi:MAG: hypothetical protein M3N13_01785, partial [Candidatus Eremiobacteraeota bacterium]|nr:hypothetical protein [Candidatus Eremiobacteraeota bacterium]
MPAPIPNTYVAQTLIGARLIESLGPWMTLHLAWLCDGIGASFEEVASIVLDVGFDGQPGYVPGYGKILDPATCPPAQLPFLGQFVGVSIPQGAD